MLLRLEKVFDKFSNVMGWIAGVLNLLMLLNVFYDAIQPITLENLSKTFSSRRSIRCPYITERCSRPKPGAFTGLLEIILEVRVV